MRVGINPFLGEEEFGRKFYKNIGDYEWPFNSFTGNLRLKYENLKREATEFIWNVVEKIKEGRRETIDLINEEIDKYKGKIEEYKKEIKRTPSENVRSRNEQEILILKEIVKFLKNQKRTIKVNMGISSLLNFLN